MSREQNSEVLFKWVYDVLCYCVGNMCDGLTTEPLEVGCGKTYDFGSSIGLVMRVSLAQLVFGRESMDTKYKKTYHALILASLKDSRDEQILTHPIITRMQVD